jgi:hypothetical protein
VQHEEQVFEQQKVGAGEPICNPGMELGTSIFKTWLAFAWSVERFRQNQTSFKMRKVRFHKQPYEMFIQTPPAVTDTE